MNHFLSKARLVFLFFFCAVCLTLPSFAQIDLTQYVNPMIGTGGHGHTFPGATLPFGMVQLSPDTRIDGSWDGCGGYHYSDSVIYGFSHTHLSGTGVSDYGDILLMPTVGEPVLTPFKNGSYKEGYASHFSHQREEAKAGYYTVHLDDDDIDVALTASIRVGVHQYTFPKSDRANIILDLAHRDEVISSSVTVVDGRHVQGMRRSHGWARDQVVYFAMEFSKQFNSYGISENNSLQPQEMMAASNMHSGKNIQAYFQFNTSQGEHITVKVGLSATSEAAARNNLERELPKWDFEQIRTDANASWNYMLNKIEVKGGTLEQKKIFYTALYHCMIAPNTYNDVDRSYRGRDGQVHNGRFTYYTVFSLWDTYRALHPLLSILAPRETGDFIQTMLAQYEQGGRLPVWELSANETDCMIGYHAVAVIADAVAKGIKGFDYQLALLAMKASAGENTAGLGAYRENGCISAEDEGESVSKTLEYAYDDWCIAQLASRINDSATYRAFIQRAQYWKNLYDPATGFFRPKKNGNFIAPFDPYEVNFNYTEANAWQYRFAVPQDVEGLQKLMGGPHKMEAALDSLFNTTSITTGREQSDISGLIGQYAHGNEPSHHMAYLYDYVGKPEKTEAMVARIMDEMYRDAPDGLVGNEDCGQMSAWYVLSAMGFYPVTPGTPYYAIGTPLFDTIKIHLDNQKTFTIQAAHKNPANHFIQSMKIDGRKTDSLMITQSMILEGKTVTFEMANQVPLQPIKVTAPPSAVNDYLIAINPLIKATDFSFKQNMQVAIQSMEAGDKLFYTKDETAPGKSTAPFVKPFTIDQSTTVKAVAINREAVQSRVVTAHYTKISNNWNLTYLTTCNPQYPGNGALCLADGDFGSANFKNGSWQGWWGNDMVVLVDLGKLQNIASAGAEFLQDQRAWILLPSRLDIEGSADGQEFKKLASITHEVPALESQTKTVILETKMDAKQVRYVRFTAHNYGKLPEGHLSAGNDAWIFCDEIFIR